MTHKVPRLYEVVTWKGVLKAVDFPVGHQVAGCSGRLYEVVQGELCKLWELRGRTGEKS